MTEYAVIKNWSYVLVHTPEFVRYGSKPMRELAKNPALEKEINSHLRPYELVLDYLPNQVFIGNAHPKQLRTLSLPWLHHSLANPTRWGRFGEIMPQEEFYALLKMASDETSSDRDLIWLEEKFIQEIVLPAINNHPFLQNTDEKTKIGQGKSIKQINQKITDSKSLPLFYQKNLIGCFHRGHEEDESLQPHILLENMSTKASAVLALKHMLKRADISPLDIDLIISCSEEAVGERYQRGGGNLARAIGDMTGCKNAITFDVKAFCAGPLYAIFVADSIVARGQFKKIAVVGGGSLAKLGMKFQGHLGKNMPILDDIIGALAFLITKDDGASPVLRTDMLGTHPIGIGNNLQKIYESIILNPLKKHGLKITDVDYFATQLENPEITVPIGQKDIPLENSRPIAVLAFQQGEINKTQINDFIRERCIQGFAPIQGHIPAGVPYIGHGIEDIISRCKKRIMIIAKGSPFLSRTTDLADSISLVIEQNPTNKGGAQNA